MSFKRVTPVLAYLAYVCVMYCNLCYIQGVTPVNKQDESAAPLVLTLDQTQISACSCASLVSKGKFTGNTLQKVQFNRMKISWLV